MKTSELFEERLKDYVKRLIRGKQVKKLGAGAYSAVFQHPEFSNMVVKVVTNRDTKYMSYLKWVMAHQDNRYVPKVVEVVPIHSETGDRYSIVFMKKLSTATYGFVKRFSQSVQTRIADRFGEEYNLDITEPSTFEPAMSKVKKLDPELHELLRFLLRPSMTHSLDIHLGNVMRDGDQLVIIDPIADEPQWGAGRIDNIR